MTFPIAHIPYANMAPFEELGPPEGCALVDYLPRDSIQALKDKQVWAAAVPVGGLSMLREETRFIGRFGIAVRQRAMSVLFFSDRPFSEFTSPLTIELTGESASSVRLMYLLLGYQHGFQRMPYLVPRGDHGNGSLVIGDRALRWARVYEHAGTVQGYTHATDLAVLWHQRFGLPFVFARWVVRKDAPQGVSQALEQWLQRYAAQEDQLIEKAAPKVAVRLDLPVEYARQYLKVIRRCLSKDDEAGQQRFLTELKRHATQPLFPRKDDSDHPLEQET